MSVRQYRGAVTLAGGRRPALIFPVTVIRDRRSLLTQIALAVLFLALAAWTFGFLLSTTSRSDTFAAVARPIMLGGGVFFLILFVLQLVGMRRPGTVAIRDHTFAGCLYLGVRTNAPALTTPRWLRMFRPMNRRIAGWDLTFAVFAMADPSEFKRIVSGCVDGPSTRMALLTDAVGA